MKEENNLSASFHPAEIIFMKEKKNSRNIFLHGAQKTQRQESISKEVIMFMILLPGRKNLVTSEINKGKKGKRKFSFRGKYFLRGIFQLANNLNYCEEGFVRWNFVSFFSLPSNKKIFYQKYFYFKTSSTFPHLTKLRHEFFTFETFPYPK